MPLFLRIFNCNCFLERNGVFQKVMLKNPIAKLVKYTITCEDHAHPLVYILLYLIMYTMERNMYCNVYITILEHIELHHMNMYKVIKKIRP